ncbi:hypothetical protein KP509_07G099500 [Ceratopteris richardii]|uniref:Uncharacterized protein n=1 Tax=Ceratopteris richardii TaxID=49495 RepID=A0A8T2UDK8_CERRI|nr:hypothetical protein KP509_07G099500 [Ceratopteris richardii]
MAAAIRKISRTVGVLVFSTFVVFLVYPTILPVFPAASRLAAQLILRLREVSALIAFTTAITIAIFSSQRKDLDDEKHQGFLEYQSLVSLSESDFGDINPFYPDIGGQSFSLSSTVHDSSIEETANSADAHRVPSTEASFESSHVQRAMVPDGESDALDKQYVQPTLHESPRPVCSMNKGAELKPIEASDAEPSVPSSKAQVLSKRGKPVKRVSFSLPSSPFSPRSLVDTDIKKSEDGSLGKKEASDNQNNGDLADEADAFIARVKKQLRMQRLESLRSSGRYP